MKTKRTILWSVIGIILVAAYPTLPTLRGIYLGKIAFWEEDAYVGKPLKDLEEMLRGRGTMLYPMLTHPDIREFRPNEDGFQFTKGKEYKWFVVGSAVNVGYVIVEKGTNGPIVKQIIRGRSMNTL